MSAQVPEEIQWLLELVVGQKWPDGDEDALRSLASTWRNAAGELDRIRLGATGDARSLPEVARGASTTAFLSYWGSKVDDGASRWASGASPAALSWAVAFCKEMGQSCEDGANGIETAKLTIIGNLVILAATLAPQLLIPGEGEAAVAVEVPIAREASEFVLKEAAQQILKRVLLEAGKMALMQGGLNLQIQLFEMAQGHRSGIDGKEVWQSARSGAIGGAIGGGFGSLSGMVGSRVGGAAGNFLGSTAGRMTTAVAGNALVNAGSDLVMNHTVSLSDLTNGGGAALLGGAAESKHGGAASDHAAAGADLPPAPNIQGLTTDFAPAGGGASFADRLAGLSSQPDGGAATVTTDPGVGAVGGSADPGAGGGAGTSNGSGRVSSPMSGQTIESQPGAGAGGGMPMAGSEHGGLGAQVTALADMHGGAASANVDSGIGSGAGFAGGGVDHGGGYTGGGAAQHETGPGFSSSEPGMAGAGYGGPTQSLYGDSPAGTGGGGGAGSYGSARMYGGDPRAYAGAGAAEDTAAAGVRHHTEDPAAAGGTAEIRTKPQQDAAARFYGERPQGTHTDTGNAPTAVHGHSDSTAFDSANADQTAGRTGALEGNAEPGSASTGDTRDGVDPSGIEANQPTAREPVSGAPVDRPSAGGAPAEHSATGDAGADTPRTDAVEAAGHEPVNPGADGEPNHPSSAEHPGEGFFQQPDRPAASEHAPLAESFAEPAHDPPAGPSGPVHDGEGSQNSDKGNTHLDSVLGTQPVAEPEAAVAVFADGTNGSNSGAMPLREGTGPRATELSQLGQGFEPAAAGHGGAPIEHGHMCAAPGRHAPSERAPLERTPGGDGAWRQPESAAVQAARAEPRAVEPVAEPTTGGRAEDAADVGPGHGVQADQPRPEVAPAQNGHPATDASEPANQYTWNPSLNHPESFPSRQAALESCLTRNVRGFSLHDDPAFRDAAAKIPPNSLGLYQIDAHGMGGQAKIGFESVSVEEIHAMLEADPNWHPGDPILLNMCSMGDSVRGFAAKLAERTGSKVVASDSLVWSDQAGHVFATDGHYENGTLVPDIPPNGHWFEYSSDGQRAQLADTAFPPGAKRFGPSLADGGPVGESFARGLEAPRWDPPTDAGAAYQVSGHEPPGHSAAADDPLRPVETEEQFTDRSGTLPASARIEVTDTAGRRRGTFYTDENGRITHADLPNPDHRIGSDYTQMRASQNPELVSPIPDVTYRIEMSHQAVVFRTDVQGNPAPRVIWDATVHETPTGEFSLRPRVSVFSLTDLQPDGHYIAHSVVASEERTTHFWTNSEGKISHLETWPSSSGALNPNTGSYGGAHAEPGERFQREVTFKVSDTLSYTDDGGRPNNQSHNTVISAPLRPAARSESTQQAVAALGTREYSNQKFDGGHIRGTAFGGPPDHLNKFPQDRDQNQGNGDSIETSWYRLERDLQSAIEDNGAVVTSWNFIGSNEINPDAATPDTVALLLTVAFPPAFNNVTMARSFPNVR